MGGCSAYGCSNHSRNKVRLFRFPANPERRKIWVENSGRTDLAIPGSGGELCAAHFDENQYEKHRQDGLKKLTPCAVPTIFPEKISNTVKTLMTIKIEPPEEDEIVFPNLDFTANNLLTPKTEPPDESAGNSCKVETVSPDVNHEIQSSLTISKKYELIPKANHLEDKLCLKQFSQNEISFSSSPWILIPKISLLPGRESKFVTSCSSDKSNQILLPQQEESCLKAGDSNSNKELLSPQNQSSLSTTAPIRKSSRIAQKKTKFKDLFKLNHLSKSSQGDCSKKEQDAKRLLQMPSDIIESKRPRLTTWRKLVPIMPKIAVTEQLPQKEGYILAKKGPVAVTTNEPKVEKKVVKAVNLFGSKSILKADSTKEDAKPTPVLEDLKRGDKGRQAEIKVSASEKGNPETRITQPSAVEDCLASKIGPTAILGIPGIVESIPYASITHLSPPYMFQILGSSQTLDLTNTQALDLPNTQALDLPNIQALDSPNTQALDSPNTQAQDLPCTQTADLPNTQTLDLPYTQIQSSILNTSRDSPQESLESLQQIQDASYIETILPPPPEFADSTHRFQNVDDPSPHTSTHRETRPRKRNILTKNSYRERVLESQAEVNKMTKLNLKAKNRINTALESFAEAQKKISQDFNRFVNFFME